MSQCVSLTEYSDNIRLVNYKSLVLEVFMKHKVLVPLDGSKLGESALSAVEKFIVAASKDEVEIVLLGVVTSLSHWVTNGEAGIETVPAGPVPYTEKELGFIKNNMDHYLDSVAKRLRRRGLVVTTEVRAGHADLEILKTIEDLNISIVAMSTHGRSGFSRLAFGSIAEKVLRQAAVPVLTVRTKD
jgi:nucleotide-binding universal stress UspA family protein